MKIIITRSMLFSGLCLFFSLSLQTTISAQEEVETDFITMEKTSANQTILSDVTVSPNPSRDKFGIKIKPVKDFEWTIQVMNGLGQKVFSQKGQYYQRLEIDVTNLANGIYFVNYLSNGERKVEKVLVQH